MTISDTIKTNFPILAEPELLVEMDKYCTTRHLTVGSNLIEIGDEIVAIPLLVEGTVKVVREDNEGNELLLYYLNRGETCASILTCCISKTSSEVRATVVDDVTIILVPIRIMDDWMRKYTTWRSFVMQAYRERMEGLLSTIDSIAFMKMDERLIKYLIKRFEESGSAILQATHQQIADDLHTSREVVSRLLKQLERLGKVKLSRNKIEIITLM